MILPNSWHGMTHTAMDMDFNIYPNKCLFCQIVNLAEKFPQMQERKK